MSDWQRTLAAKYETLERLLTTTPFSIEVRTASSMADQPSGHDADPDSARARAVRLGRAFHEAMDGAELAHEPDLHSLALEAGKRQRLDSKGVMLLWEMLNLSLASDLMGRARECFRSGRRVWRELPYVRAVGPVPAEIEEGKIDLLFEEEDGWVLVDYKTDQVPEGPNAEQDFAAKHRGQVKAYVAAMKSMGIMIKAAYLLFARSGSFIEIPS